MPQKYKGSWYANKLDNLEEIDKFLETYNLPILDREEIENLKRSKKEQKIESATKNLPRQKTPGPDGLTDEFHQTFKQKLMSVLLKLFQKLKRKEHSQTHFMRLPFFLYRNQRRTLQEKKIQANIPDEYRYKNSQQNTSKSNWTAQEKDYTLWFSSIYPWDARMVQHAQIQKCDIPH